MHYIAHIYYYIYIYLYIYIFTMELSIYIYMHIDNSIVSKWYQTLVDKRLNAKLKSDGFIEQNS